MEHYKPASKPHIKLMKTNFYYDIQGGFEHFKKELSKTSERATYLKNFLTIDLDEPKKLQ